MVFFFFFGKVCAETSTLGTVRNGRIPQLYMAPRAVYRNTGETK